MKREQILSSPIEDAHKTYFEADNETNRLRQRGLYLNASKAFAEAASRSADCKNSPALEALLLLSAACLRRADIIHSYASQTSSNLNADESLPAFGFRNEHEEIIVKSGRISTYTTPPINRLSQASGSVGLRALDQSVMRISNRNINNIPMAVSVGDLAGSGISAKSIISIQQDAVNDLFFLEKKLAELGNVASQCFFSICFSPILLIISTNTGDSCEFQCRAIER